MTTLEKMRMIKRLMDEVVGEITDVAEQVKDIEHSAGRNLLIRALNIDKVAKNFDNGIMNPRINDTELEMAYAEKLITNSK